MSKIQQTAVQGKQQHQQAAAVGGHTPNRSVLEAEMHILNTVSKVAICHQPL